MAALLLVAGCQQTATQGDRSIVTTLIFGTRIDEVRNVTDAEWEQFVEHEITPRFPDGFTIDDADGRWRGKDGKTIRERSYMLLVVRPANDRAMGAKLEELRTVYCKQFQQEAVLRIDEPDARVRF